MAETKVKNKFDEIEDKRMSKEIYIEISKQQMILDVPFSKVNVSFERYMKVRANAEEAIKELHGQLKWMEDMEKVIDKKYKADDYLGRKKDEGMQEVENGYCSNPIQ